jgi:hypothetical protein
LRGDVDAVAAEADDGLLQVVQHMYDPGDTDPDGVLEVMDYRQGGHHRRQVGLDRVTALMEEEAKPARSEEPLDRPPRFDGGNDPSRHHCLHQTGRFRPVQLASTNPPMSTPATPGLRRIVRSEPLKEVSGTSRHPT